MDRALDVTGQQFSLEPVGDVRTLVIIKDVMIQQNASGIVGCHLSSCEYQRVYVGRVCSLMEYKISDPGISISLTGTMYPVRGCNQVATFLFCLRKLVGIQQSSFFQQDRQEVYAHMYQNLTHCL